MKLAVKNFRGVKAADITIAPLALIAGANAAGKTSIAQALAALLSGETMPVAEIQKKDAGMLVRSGGGAGEIILDHGKDSRARIAYPSAKLTTEGDTLSASRIACGLDSLPDMDRKDAASALIHLLKASPSPEDVAAALVKLGLTTDHAKRMNEAIKSSSWDNVHQDAKSKGIKLKGQWEEVTGERYGSAKGGQWIPTAWETDLAGESEETLHALVVQAQEGSDAAVAVDAVSDHERKQVENLANMVPMLRAKKEQAQATLTKTGDELKAATAKTDGLPKPLAQNPTQPCPKCGERLIILPSAVPGGTAVLAVQGQTNPSEDKSRAKAIEDARRSAQDAAKAYSDASKAAQSIDVDLQKAEEAAARLKTMGDASGDAAAIEAARGEVTRAEARLAAFKAKTRADALHRSITVNQEIVAMLAPEGLRLTKLRGAIKEFNERMMRLSIATESHGWGVVEVSEDIGFSYDSRPWVLLSQSERFRVRTTLQASIAQLDGSAALIVDAADVLDRPGRNGLMRLLKAVGLPAMVCMTILKREECPKLTAPSASYWVENGEAVAV